MTEGRRRAGRWTVPILGVLAILPALAQTNAPAPVLSGGTFVRGTWQDGKRIFSSPAHIRKKDWPWIVPLVGVTSFLLATDNRNMRERIHTGATARDRANTVSNLSVGALALAPAYLSWQGWRNRDSYEEETGWLAARAVVDTLASGEVLRVVTRRDRPTATGAGDFANSSATGGSFPSLHAASAWAMASVVAQRYPGWLTEVAVYGLASGVSVSRVISREHAPSDVLVGSALGFLIGRYVAGTGSLPLPRWFRGGSTAVKKEPGSAADQAESESAYVPMDSWIYDALDRLAALGLVPSQVSGLRPWTRAECRRQAVEADEKLQKTNFGPEIAELVAALRHELGSSSHSTSSVTLQNIYTRTGVIAGPVLNDSFHFGQTWIGDNGRPFGRGLNSYSGFTASAESGRFFAYYSGEYQHAPGSDPYSLPIRQTISSLDGIPLQPAVPRTGTNRFRAIEAYAGVRLGDLEFSVGKQALWWGPTYDAPLSFSNNAEPTKNLRVSTIHPLQLGWLGEVRAEFVMGKLGGQQYTWRPWFNAQKISLKLTSNLEMGFTRWSIFWGVGHPITVHSFIRNFTSTSSPLGPTGIGASDPGDRKGGFDFRYRIPGLRNWLTLYSDSYCDDDPSPLAAPRRAAINPGIHLTRVPGIPKLDFRVEAPATTPLDGSWDYLGLNYWNGEYRSGNTNYGYLLGSWVGRDARAIEAWSTYWFSPRNKIQLGFRHLKGSAKFLPGGSTQSEVSIQNSFAFSREWSVHAFVQHEKFYIPLLGPRESNTSGWVQLTWEPKLQILGRGTRK